MKNKLVIITITIILVVTAILYNNKNVDKKDDKQIQYDKALETLKNFNQDLEEGIFYYIDTDSGRVTEIHLLPNKGLKALYLNVDGETELDLVCNVNNESYAIENGKELESKLVEEKCLEHFDKSSEIVEAIDYYTSHLSEDNYIKETKEAYIYEDNIETAEISITLNKDGSKLQIEFIGFNQDLLIVIGEK